MAGQVLVHRSELPGQAHDAAHRVGLPNDVVSHDARSALVGAQERGQHADRRGLAGAVRPEQAENRARWHGEVDAVHGSGSPEDLDQAGSFDGWTTANFHRVHLLTGTTF